MSYPSEYTLFRTEGKFWHGPDGVKVSPDCPFVIRRMAELKDKPFQQVRHQIMKVFQLNEATHELTLQHLVYPRTDPGTPPCNVLIDIIGEDSWRTFLNVAARNVRSFRLFARWNVKETSSAPNSTDSNNTTVPDEADESDDGSWPNCKHDRPCTIETSWRTEDPGRRLFRCPLFMHSGEDCKFSKWLDKKFPKKAIKVINRLQDDVESLQQQVENMKCELEELCHRQHKRATKEAVASDGDRCLSGSSPCDLACRSRGEQTRPSKAPRLATDN
ncbi:uncharacterized protein LOC125539483 [Triticum urartu]|uniref:uncharacterized protein LOC125539483 n=1 Tax=Triticum urartu TaxID=4572 RepID=UPI00204307DF|nr:uncharacterized protein LOC125539483 [Triticum urartu]